MNNDLKFFALFLVGVIALIAGLSWLLIWDSSRDAKDRQAECRQVAEAAQANYWREKDYNCLIIKDGRVIYDK